MKLEICGFQNDRENHVDACFFEFLYEKGFRSEIHNIYNKDAIMDESFCKYPERILNHPKTRYDVMKSIIERRILEGKDYYILSNDIIVLAAVQYITALYRLENVKCHILTNSGNIITTNVSSKTGSLEEFNYDVFDVYDKALNDILDISIINTTSKTEHCINQRVLNDIERKNKNKRG